MVYSGNSTSISKYYADTERVVGRVKWFNSKTGFGFLSTLGAESKDIFVHHSELKVNEEQYRYLTQGEYVEFTISVPEEGSEHKFIATSVTGIMKEALLCETRRSMRLSRYDSEEQSFEQVKTQRRTKQSIRGGGPRSVHRSSSPTKGPRQTQTTQTAEK